MKETKFSFAKRLKSFSYAFNGLKILLKEEQNSRIHTVGAILAIILSFVLKISLLEWMAIIFAIGIVFIIELVNTAIEHIANFISPEKNIQIKIIKDLAAAAVLISAIIAIIIGSIVFLPKIKDYFTA